MNRYNKRKKLLEKIKRQKIREKGITLIALVVTIIILLILAGVTLSLTLSQNGLFSRAQNAAEKYKTAQSQEEDEINKFSDMMYGLVGEGKDDETPGKMAGTGTEKDPYLVQSIEDLIEFSRQVNTGTSYEDQIVKLAVNLDFKSENSYVDYESKKEELTTGSGFTPIGNDSNPFKGSFDGGNHRISNLYINRIVLICHIFLFLLQL